MTDSIRRMALGGMVENPSKTFDSYLEASQFIAATEKRQGFEIYSLYKTNV